MLTERKRLCVWLLEGVVNWDCNWDVKEVLVDGRRRRKIRRGCDRMKAAYELLYSKKLIISQEDVMSVE
jgi:hypothetical protein